MTKVPWEEHCFIPPCPEPMESQSARDWTRWFPRQRQDGDTKWWTWRTCNWNCIWCLLLVPDTRLFKTLGVSWVPGPLLVIWNDPFWSCLTWHWWCEWGLETLGSHGMEPVTRKAKWCGSEFPHPRPLGRTGNWTLSPVFKNQKTTLEADELGLRFQDQCGVYN